MGSIAVIRGKQIHVEKGDNTTKGQWLLTTLSEIGMTLRKNEPVEWDNRQWLLKATDVSRFHEECAILIIGKPKKK